MIPSSMSTGATALVSNSDPDIEISLYRRLGCCLVNYLAHGIQLRERPIADLHGAAHFSRYDRRRIGLYINTANGPDRTGCCHLRESFFQVCYESTKSSDCIASQGHWRRASMVLLAFDRDFKLARANDGPRLPRSSPRPDPEPGLVRYALPGTR